MARVDSMRAKSDAIMVGVATVIADDPGLRVKSEQLRSDRISSGRPGNPLRVVADSLARTPPDAQVLGNGPRDGCLIGVCDKAPEKRLADLARRCEIVRCGHGRVNLRELLNALSERGVNDLMVEGGGTLNWSMISEGLVDEICVYVGSLIIGGNGAPTPVDGDGFASDFPKLKLIFVEALDDGALMHWRVINQ